MVRSCYIHIPFCKHICSYCDFCKMYYNEKWCWRYLKALEEEIYSNYRGEKLETIYIGGGTPSCLNVLQLEKLFDIIQIFSFAQNCEITIECNVETLTREKLELFFKHGVNRLSIGLESTDSGVLNFLGRSYTKEDIEKVLLLAQEVGFRNINVDMMYAVPNQHIELLENDLYFFLKFDIPHISTYSLMIEEHTKLKNNGTYPISEELDALMYQKIHDILTNHGYQHYEISNFGKPGYFSKHNLTYWRNEEYYGFGLGASGYVSDTRYTNTRSFPSYEEGEFLLEKEKMTYQLDMENEIMLGLRTMKGISKERFFHKFGCDLKEKYDILELLEKGYLVENESSYVIPFSYWYLSNEIIVRFIGE